MKMLQTDIFTPTIRQVLATSSVGLTTAGLMSAWGYPAAALPQMEHPNSTINFTPDQASWFATVTLLLSIPGSVVGAAICEWIGPRRLFLILSPLLCFSFTVMAAASWKVVLEAGMAEILLLTSRVAQGSLVALLVPAVSVYTYEISGHRIRGTLTSLIEVWATWGFLLCYITACFLSWVTIAWLLPLITIVPGYLILLWSPESPLWLARKGKEEEARTILNQFRCSSQEVSEELKVIQNNLKDDVTFAESLRVLVKKPNILAIIASSTMTIMKEVTGFAVILIYMVHIFDAAGVGLDPRYSAVIVGTVRLTCNCIASLLLHNFRRKILLVCGNTLAGAAAGVIGVFFYLQSSGYDVSLLGWLPLAGLATHMFGCAAAIGPTTWIMAVEVLPGPIRSIGFGIAVTSFSIAAFVISKTFIDLQSLIGMHGVFWFFGGGALSYIVIVIFFLPETYGRSLQDIEDYWNNSTKKKGGVSV